MQIFSLIPDGTPLIYLPFDEIQSMGGQASVLGSENGEVVGTILLKSGIKGMGISASGDNSMINYGNKFDSTCVRKPDLCPKGVTVSIWFKIIEDGDFKIIHCGSKKGIGGIWVEGSSYQMQGSISTEIISQNGKFFQLSILDTTPTWYHMVVSIRPGTGGFRTYIDGEFEYGDTDVTDKFPGDKDSSLVVCMSVERILNNMEIQCDELMVWGRAFDDDEIMELYQSYFD